jgi:hypothetical protein
VRVHYTTIFFVLGLLFFDQLAELNVVFHEHIQFFQPQSFERFDFMLDLVFNKVDLFAELVYLNLGRIWFFRDISNLVQKLIVICILPLVWLASVLQVVKVIKNRTVYHLFAVYFLDEVQHVFTFVLAQLPEKRLFERFFTCRFIVSKFVSAEEILDFFSDAANYVFEDTFDKDRKEIVEIKVLFLRVDGGEYELLSSRIVHEDAHVDEELTDIQNWKFLSFYFGLLRLLFKVVFYEFVPPTLNDFDLLIDVKDLFSNHFVFYFYCTLFYCLNFVQTLCFCKRRFSTRLVGFINVGDYVKLKPNPLLRTLRYIHIHLLVLAKILHFRVCLFISHKYLLVRNEALVSIKDRRRQFSVFNHLLHAIKLLLLGQPLLFLVFFLNLSLIF